MARPSSYWIYCSYELTEAASAHGVSAEVCTWASADILELLASCFYGMADPANEWLWGSCLLLGSLFLGYLLCSVLSNLIVFLSYISCHMIIFWNLFVDRKRVNLQGRGVREELGPLMTWLRLRHWALRLYLWGWSVPPSSLSIQSDWDLKWGLLLLQTRL